MREIQERRKVLSENRLYFKCTGTNYRVSACKGKRICQLCLRKHYTSICDKYINMMFVTENLAIHPVVILRANTVTCHALLDTSALQLLHISCIIKQTHSETDSERDQEH